MGELSEKSKIAINLWLERFPVDQKRSAVIPALMIVQKEHSGSLTEELMDAVASYLNLPEIEVYEVATFYSMYELKPVGKHKICVCTNLSCMLCGSDDVMKYLQEKLEINCGEITNDGKFSIKEVECLGACGGAPVLQIGDHYYENLTPDKIDVILQELE